MSQDLSQECRKEEFHLSRTLSEVDALAGEQLKSYQSILTIALPTLATLLFQNAFYVIRMHDHHGHINAFPQEHQRFSDRYNTEENGQLCLLDHLLLVIKRIRDFII